MENTSLINNYQQYNLYPDIIQYNPNNPIVRSPNAVTDLYFYQTKETLMDVDVFRSFVKNAERRFRASKEYKAYKSYLIEYLGIDRCQILGNAYHNGTLINTNMTDTSSTPMKVLIYIALIMGLLLFAKKAPDMLKDLFPGSNAASGDFGLKGGSRVAPMAARAAGAALGATTGLRTAAMTGISQAKRNRDNKRFGKRQEAKDTLANKKDALSRARKNRRNLRDQKDSMDRQAYREQMRAANQSVAEARREKADAKIGVSNTRWRSGAAAAVGGFIGGTARGAVTGAGLKKMLP